MAAQCIHNDSLLLLDSWSDQTDAHIFKDEEIVQMLDNKTIHTKVIPPKIKRFVQYFELCYVNNIPNIWSLSTVDHN